MTIQPRPTEPAAPQWVSRGAHAAHSPSAAEPAWARSGRRAWMQWVGIASNDPAPDHEFFTASDLRFLRAAVSRLLPQDKYPSTSQAGVVQHIDRQLAGPYGQAARLVQLAPARTGSPRQACQLGLTPAELYRESLDALALHDAGRAFATHAPAQQDAFLRQLEAGHWLLKRVPSSVFFDTLMANTVEAFFADPMHPRAPSSPGPSLSA